MAKPNKKLPSKTVTIICGKCKTKLFKYAKGGKGSLVKCFKERILKDYTEQNGHCPNCGIQFGRDTLVRGTPAFTIIGDKAVMK